MNKKPFRIWLPFGAIEKPTFDDDLLLAAPTSLWW